MDTITLQNQLTALRSSDGELERRLSELDSKLGSWLSLIQAQHAALVKLARKVVPHAVPREVGTLVPPAETTPVQSPLEVSTPDEELLETLDPETARAIRIKRRLCHGSRSVQELLEEYRAAQAPAPSKPSKPAVRRGWWRRDND